MQIKKKMSCSNNIVCEIHGDSFIVENYSSGDIVCSQCGLVIVNQAVHEHAEWRFALDERCIIENPEKKELVETLYTNYANPVAQIKKFKEHHERFLDMFFDEYKVEAHVVLAAKENFLFFKKEFSNVDLEILVCAVIFYTLEFFGCIVTLPQIIFFAPRLSMFAVSTALTNKILKFKRKMEEIKPYNFAKNKDEYFFNFTERLAGHQIIKRKTAPIFLKLLKEMNTYLETKIDINSKRPLQTSTVVAAFYILQKKSPAPKDLLKKLCFLAGIKDNSINYWMQIIKNLKISPEQCFNNNNNFI